MNHFLIGQLGLVAVSLAVVRSADDVHALHSALGERCPNLRRPELLAAASRVSSTLYARCIASDLRLLSAALVNPCAESMTVVVPTMVAGLTQPEAVVTTSSREGS
ncbi:hypothetical protein [Paracidovorax cattleyae]|uniref:hypothetical protein n=1 Tax=Paracidovorax cattleyae TaxID=80868 RepID=UPI001E4AA6FF|nr:hypothetical protein [Paracidovorax cattleyae]